MEKILAEMIFDLFSTANLHLSPTPTPQQSAVQRKGTSIRNPRLRKRRDLRNVPYSDKWEERWVWSGIFSKTSFRLMGLPWERSKGPGPVSSL